MIPVRCFTCNKVLGNKELTYQSLIAKGTETKRIWVILGITRVCCKGVMMSSVDLTEETNNYENFEEGKYLDMRKCSPGPRVYDAV